MIIGYARVSTDKQELFRQLDRLINYGVEERHIFTEKMTGTIKDRPELTKLLEYVQKGDIVIITELSRLGRSTKDLISISEELNKKGVELVSLKENLDTTTATGKLMFGMLAVLSQFERDIISERTVEGLKSARARGKVGGRKPIDATKLETALTLYDTGKYSVSKITEMTTVSKDTIYRYLRQRNTT